MNLVLLSAALALPAAAELTQEETALKDACVANISQKVYSPKEAEKCVKALEPKGDFYKKLKEEDSDTLNYILKFDGIFTELGDFFRDNPRDCHIRKRYRDLLEISGYQEACVLCELDMGPQPDKTFPWIGKYYNGSLAPAQNAALAWNIAAPPRQAMFANMGITQARWAEMTLSQRTAAIMAETAISNQANFPTEVTKCSIISGTPQQFLDAHLPQDIRNNIRQYLARLMPAPGAPGAGGPGAGTDPSKYSEAARNLAGKSDAEMMAYLGGVFDKKADLGGGYNTEPFAKPKPAKPTAAATYVLPEDKFQKVADEMMTRMLGGVSKVDNKKRTAAFSGTPLEEELRKFYNEKDRKGNLLHPMQLKVLDLGDGGTNGAYCPKHATNGCGGGLGGGQIAVNKQLIEAWMKKNKCTAARLEKDPAMMDKLGRHLYGVILHEGIHNVHQDEFYIANGVSNKKILDKEAVAFAGQAAGMMKKFKDPKYGRQYKKEASEFDMECIQAFEKGGYRGMKQFIRYYNLEGAQGVGAKTILQMENGMKELEQRKTDPAYAAAPRVTADCSWFDIRNCSTEQLNKMTAEAYPWYETVITRQKEDIAMLNGQLASITAKGKPSRAATLQIKKVQELNDESL